MNRSPNNRLWKTASVAGCVAFSLVSVSCETTGDPSTGGIFWSEAKAKQRLAERQQRLDQLEGKTSSTRADSRQKQAEIDQLQR